mmetsp:Transcript_24750/g.64962  ORF Transcript_24750/g.64962 Transcript_24750/m.64962 type:complete len:220 (+) Transcript_24750:382-1041(+)
MAVAVADPSAVHEATRTSCTRSLHSSHEVTELRGGGWCSLAHELPDWSGSLNASLPHEACESDVVTHSEVARLRDRTQQKHILRVALVRSRYYTVALGWVRFLDCAQEATSTGVTNNVLGCLCEAWRWPGVRNLHPDWRGDLRHPCVVDVQIETDHLRSFQTALQQNTRVDEGVFPETSLHFRAFHESVAVRGHGTHLANELAGRPRPLRLATNHLVDW